LKVKAKSEKERGSEMAGDMPDFPLDFGEAQENTVFYELYPPTEGIALLSRLRREVTE
jgi:hypothetical protein